MTKITTDFSQATTGEFETLPVGTYSARITDVDVKVSQATQAPYLAVTMTVFNATDTKWNGRKVWDNVQVTGAGAWKAKSLIEAATREPFNAETLDTEMLLTRELSISVKHEVYEGKTQAKVASYAVLA
jgi:hypothetical protein